MKQNSQAFKKFEVICISLLLALLALGISGCTGNRGFEIFPLNNQNVLTLSSDDIVRVMRRAGFSDNQILQYGEDLHLALSQYGALSALTGKRREALWEVSGAGRWRKTGQEGRGGQKGEPHGDWGDGILLEGDEIMPHFSVLNQLESIGWDYLSTGHSVQGHPLEPFRQELISQGLPDAQGVTRMRDGQEVSYAGMVICRQRPMTAGGVVFMTLEDESGFVNLVVWSTVFEKFRKIILSSTVLGVTGKLQSQDGVVHLIVDSCWKPSLSRPPSTKDSRDFH